MSNSTIDQWNFLYINGEQVVLPESINVHDPATGAIVGRVPNGGEEITRRAIDAASEAVPAWAKLTAKHRSSYLHDWADRIGQNVDMLATLLSEEQGKPLGEAIGEVEGCIDVIRWCAEEGRRVYGETIPGSQPNQRILVWRQPVGVVGLITPWNFPASMVARKLSPALAAGCTVILKPAIKTPLIAIALFKHLMDTGIPPGVANIVTGHASIIGSTLLGDSRVRKISFTGSTEIGKNIMRKAADHVKRLSLELGGNAPAIVFSDANIEQAAEAIVSNKFENCGQVCNGINLIFAQQDIATELTAQITKLVAGLKVGKGTEKGMQVGPMIDSKSLDKVESLVVDAKRKGATIKTGGYRLEGKNYNNGSFYAPTVLEGVTMDMQMTKEEIFGPVAPILSFNNENDLIDACNRTPYGLAAYVFTNNVNRIYRVSEALEFGMIAINTTSLSVPQAPFGGIKESGMGREGGHHGLEDFLELKYVNLKINNE